MMIAIKLVDARRGLNIKCRELFKDEKIAESIYRYLCDGIEECDDVEPERKHGEWVGVMTEAWCTFDECKCSVCGVVEYFNKGWKKFSYCPNCGAKMREEGDNDGT